MIISKLCGSDGAFYKRHRFNLTRWERMIGIYTDTKTVCMHCGFIEKVDKGENE